jgi:hypothetical protein
MAHKQINLGCLDWATELPGVIIKVKSDPEIFNEDSDNEDEV